MRSIILGFVASGVRAGRPLDLVESLPGFEDVFETGLFFSIYSGYLDVDLRGTDLPYDGLRIHYELHTCKEKSLTTCPLAVWHQVQSSMSFLLSFMIVGPGWSGEQCHLWGLDGDGGVQADVTGSGHEF